MVLWYYKIFGLTVESDYELVEAYSIEKPQEVQVRIHLQEDMPDEYKYPTKEEREREIPLISHFDKDWACNRYREHGTFIMSKGEDVAYYLQEGYDKTLVSQILLCRCMSVISAQRGRLVLHGSGIYYNGKCLAISGESGAGKSSLASEIMQRNHLQMSDDQVVIDIEGKQAVVYPGFPVRKLCADAVEKLHVPKDRLVPMPDDGRDKYGLLLKEEYYAKKAPVGAMVIIRAGQVEKPQIEEITGSARMKYITENLFMSVMYETAGFPPELFLKAVAAANQMPVYVLTRPQEGMTVKEQADLIDALAL